MEYTSAPEAAKVRKEKGEQELWINIKSYLLKMI